MRSAASSLARLTISHRASPLPRQAGVGNTRGHIAFGRGSAHSSRPCRRACGRAAGHGSYPHHGPAPCRRWSRTRRPRRHSRKHQAADRQHRRRFVQHQFCRGRWRQGQCTAPGQRPTGPAARRVASRQGPADARCAASAWRNSQKAPQFLAGVATRVCRRAIRHRTERRAAAQFQHRRAGQQVERPPAGRVLAEQCQMRAEVAAK